MSAYKYTLKSGKTLWYANFYYTDWTGEKKHICKRGFKTQREAKDYERSFLDQQNTSRVEGNSRRVSSICPSSSAPSCPQEKPKRRFSGGESVSSCIRC